MAAIMLNHEQAHQKGARRYGQQHCKCNMYLQCKPHRNPETAQWDQREGNFPYCLAIIGDPIGFQPPRPVAGCNLGKVGPALRQWRCVGKVALER